MCEYLILKHGHLWLVDKSCPCMHPSNSYSGKFNRNYGTCKECLLRLSFWLAVEPKNRKLQSKCIKNSNKQWCEYFWSKWSCHSYPLKAMKRKKNQTNHSGYCFQPHKQLLSVCFGSDVWNPVVLMHFVHLDLKRQRVLSCLWFALLKCHWRLRMAALWSRKFVPFFSLDVKRKE